MDTFGFNSQQVEYPRILNIYFLVYGISIIAVMGLIVQYCRRRDIGKNRLRREYIV
jgi:hypothetical protein